MRSVRVFFKKNGRMKFISHLDLNRFMIRMIRKSGIPVWYSEGFNPHPYITFALPLSLGFDSDYEVMDIRLDNDSYENELVLEKIKNLMPQGIEVFGVSNPILKAGDVAFARFAVEFDNISAFSEQILSFLSADVIEAEKKTKKGGTKVINLKEYVRSFKILGNTLVLDLAAGGANNLNPKLLLDTFAQKVNIELPPCSITRQMIFDVNMNEFK